MSKRREESGHSKLISQGKRVRTGSANRLSQWLTLLILLGLAVSPVRADLLLASNGVHYGPGDMLELSIGLDATAGLNDQVDIYFAVIPPASETALFISGEPGSATVTSGALGDPNSWTPLAQGVVLSQVGDIAPAPWLSVPLPEGLPTGDYRVAFATTEPGTVNVVDSIFRTVRILENSIKGNLGFFDGSWFNTTFSSAGDMRHELKEMSPGMFELMVDVDENVGGLPQDREPKTYPFSVEDFSGDLNFQFNDSEFFNGPVVVSWLANGEIELNIDDVGMGGFVSFEANGTRDGDDLEMEYTVNFGTQAVGTISTTREDN